MGIFDLLDYFRLPTRLFGQHDVPVVAASDSHDQVTSLPIPRTSPSPKRSMHIPLEVVIHILNLTGDDDATTDKATMASCALVCKDWSFAAQELLFKQVTLNSEAALQSFRTAVNPSLPRGVALASAVKRLHCIVDTKQPQGLSLKAFGAAVTLCPNLQSLHLALFSPPSAPSVAGDASQLARSVPNNVVFGADVLSALRTGPRITSLRFDNWSNDDSALAQLLDNMPAVTSLSISGKTPSLPSPQSEPFSSALQELRLNFQTAPSTDFLRWLLYNSATTLRALEFQREPSIALLDYLVMDHCESLESLVLPACASQEGTALLARCSQLRELRLENAWVAPGVRRELPATLERLALAVDKDTPLQPVVQAIKRAASLSSITLHLWADGERHPQLAAVKIACATRGIQLKVMRDIRVFRTIKRGYPIHGLPFSHAKSTK
ncbi:hypothetical protein BDW22DRAFT_1424121 [Trametopsis cervina]|nr:hypothetical protein BDW22DRAFT_1424121 [Trametopsis cervina]